jgi:YARHG domain
MRRLSPALFVALTIAGLPAVAQTNQCYEEIGCMSTARMPEAALGRLSCQSLWEVRNRVYQDRGYCFRTERALAVFSNQGCSVTSENDVQFNEFERANIAAIKRAESRKGCP